jgi:hypothetical protein
MLTNAKCVAVLMRTVIIAKTDEERSAAIQQFDQFRRNSYHENNEIVEMSETGLEYSEFSITSITHGTIETFNDRGQCVGGNNFPDVELEEDQEVDEPSTLHNILFVEGEGDVIGEYVAQKSTNEQWYHAYKAFWS